MSDPQICAACGETSDAAARPCPACGADPLLDGRYRLRAILGKGGVGLTFRAERLADGLAVAVKEMPFHFAQDADVRRLVEREARVLRQLNHPAIPDYVDDFVAGTGRHRALYLVQELVEGQDLKAEQVGRRYSLDEVLAVVEELCGILGYLHGLHPPVIHRDIKPGNVMRRPDGRLVLLDFGAVRDAVQETALGGQTVAGTFGYMAPEQFKGDASPATDLYGLGVLAVELLTRQTPDALLDGQRLEWRKWVKVPAPVTALLADMLEPDPLRRAKDARALQERVSALRAQLAAGPATALAARPEAHRPMPPARQVSDPLRRAQAHYRIQPAQALQIALPEHLRPRKKSVTLLLAVFLGWLGGPHWYLGHYISGAASVLFAWTFLPVLFSLMRAVQILRMPDYLFDRIYNEAALDNHLLSLSPPEPASRPGGLTAEATEQLERLARLKAAGVLTEAEFNDQKARILGG